MTPPYHIKKKSHLRMALFCAKNRRHRVVKPLQQRLNALGYPCGTADGVFGGKSRAAVLALQTEHGLAADGVVGKATWAVLTEG